MVCINPTQRGRNGDFYTVPSLVTYLLTRLQVWVSRDHYEHLL
jgi:hypothetical protein